MIHILFGTSSMAGRVRVTCLLGAQINRQSVYKLSWRYLFTLKGCQFSKLWKTENLISPPSNRPLAFVPRQDGDRQWDGREAGNGS
jgi:hypothetical protein